MLSASSPADCFETAFEACRLTVEHMTPVILLSDGFIANGAEPWLLPKVEDLPTFSPNFHTDPETFAPFRRDPDTLARLWAIPGTPGLEHRIGGLEKADDTGNVSYDHKNHEHMTDLRQQKIDRLADLLPPLEVHDDLDAELLVLGWGSTQGAIAGAVSDAPKAGMKVARAHLRHLNPFPANIAEVLNRYPRILLPENNSGQLALLLQGRFLKKIDSLTKVQGLPFKKTEILDAIRSIAAVEA